MRAGEPVAADVIDDLIDDLERGSAASPDFPDDTFVEVHGGSARHLPTRFIPCQDGRRGPAIQPRALFREILQLADRGRLDDARTVAWTLYRALVANCEEYRAALGE